MRNRVLEDGEILHVPLVMMDGMLVEMPHDYSLHGGMGNEAGHKPGYVFGPSLANDPRQAAYADYDRRLSDAWKPRNSVTAAAPVISDVAEAHIAYE